MCRWPHSLWVGAILLSCSCASQSDPSETSPAGGSSEYLLDPALFDCTATGIPARVSSTPVACGLDPSCRTPQVTGHRGAGGQLGKIAPENTMAAYRAAIALGLDYVETDPRPTADGVLVNVHDTTVDRTTDGSGQVDELSYDQIQNIHIAAEPFAGDFSCERIPSLEQVLTTCRGKVLVLVDANKTDRVDLLVAAIQQTDSLDWAIFDTSSVAKIDEALALEPGLHTMIRVDSATEAQEQLAHFADHPPVIVEVDSAAPLESVATAVHGLDNRVLTDVFVYDMAATLDDDSGIYQEAFAPGIDIVQSDRPELVLDYLERR